jgi:anti-sigma factor RsiW
MTELPEMPCQELVEVITDYLDDALDANDRARFDAHLEECDACQDYVDQFRQTIALTGQIEPEELSPQTREQLLRAFRDWRVRS